MKQLPLSVCIITLNEATNIDRCLSSVPFASDIVVLDSGSTDSTRVLAEQKGARVFNEEWRGFGPQKQRAVELAQYDWVLCLDADEEVSPELAAEIVAEFSNGATGSPQFSGYRVPRRSFHLGRWLAHGGWYPDYQTRLFDRRSLRWTQSQIHESVQGENLGVLRADLRHYPFENLADQIQTNNRYSSLGALTLHEAGQKFSYGQFLFKPLVKFIELYLFKGGIWDGWPGYIIAVGGAYSIFLKYAKLWELQKLAKRKA